ncbi:MAG: hypothetical protein ABFD16_18855 [Thermoguttaceae bacterium]|jgi:hypothetical protein
MLETVVSLLGRLVVVLVSTAAAWLCFLGLRDMLRRQAAVDRSGEAVDKQSDPRRFWSQALAIAAAMVVFAWLAIATVISLFRGG